MFAQYAGLKSYKVVELDERDDGDQIQDYLGKITPVSFSSISDSSSSARATRPDAQKARAAGAAGEASHGRTLTVVVLSRVCERPSQRQARSVPRVFVGGKFIGGGDDTAALHSRGELKSKLEAAGAI